MAWKRARCWQDRHRSYGRQSKETEAELGSCAKRVGEKPSSSNAGCCHNAAALILQRYKNKLNELVAEEARAAVNLCKSDVTLDAAVKAVAKTEDQYSNFFITRCSQEPLRSMHRISCKIRAIIRCTNAASPASSTVRIAPSLLHF